MVDGGRPRRRPRAGWDGNGGRRGGGGKLNILLSAYACAPGEGSEPGVGWNLARELAKRHRVWVLTRANNAKAIEEELARRPVEGLTPVYFDLPGWMMWWKRGARGFRVYYYLWQLGAYAVARRLHAMVSLDIAHHVTFVKYASPSFISLLPVPFMWGPVGGGESTPRAFLRELSVRGRIYESARSLARWAGELDPFVRLTARRSQIAFATTDDTARRLAPLGAKNVIVRSEAGLSRADMEMFASAGRPPEQPFTFVSMGRLLHLKGFHLGLRAFAAAGIPAELIIVGDGPERGRLQQLAQDLGIPDRVRFVGHTSRADALAWLARSHVLVHPSLHESGGWVCLEAMGMGKPVICLALGGPAQQVAPDCGFVIPAERPEESVSQLAFAMQQLATDRALRARMGAAGRERVREFHWESKAEAMVASYQQVLDQTSGATDPQTTRGGPGTPGPPPLWSSA